MTQRSLSGYYSEPFVNDGSVMSHENENHRNKMGMFAPGRSSDIDRCVEETETVLRNTRAFLEGLYESDERAREHVREMSESLERDVQRLRGRKEGK